MAVENLITPCIGKNSITAESKQQPLLIEKNPIISSKRLNHSSYNCEESSFRIYYGANNGDISIPFKWESHPGTPKHNSDHHRRGQSKSNQPSPTSKRTTTPLTPPPSYQLKNPTTSGSSPRLSSKININHFLSTALPRRFILLKNSSSSAATTANSVDPSSHSLSSSSSSPRTSLSSLWASESSDPSHSPRITPTPLVRRTKTRTCVNDMDQTTGCNNKQQVNKKRSSTVDEKPQCSTTCFGTPTPGTAATAYASTGGSNGGGYSSPMRSTVKKAILSVVSCRVMRSSNHHVDYIV